MQRYIVRAQKRELDALNKSSAQRNKQRLSSVLSCVRRQSRSLTCASVAAAAAAAVKAHPEMKAIYWRARTELADC